MVVSSVAGRNAVADAHGDVADDSVHGRNHLVVAQLHLLGAELLIEILELFLGGIEAGLGLVQHHRG